VLHRASVVEIAVPYAEPRAPFHKKCAFDVVDYGLGYSCSSLELGCDCLGHIHYFDATLSDSKGTWQAWTFPCAGVASVTRVFGRNTKKHALCLPYCKLGHCTREAYMCDYLVRPVQGNVVETQRLQCRPCGCKLSLQCA